jgi:nucleotide-binding universal stress UspA family protein
MPTKMILCVTGVDHSTGDLITAAELAQRSEAHLSAIVISSVPPTPVGDLVGQAYSTWSFVWQEEKNRLNARVSDLRHLLTERGLVGDIEAIYCAENNIDYEVAERARYTDLILLGSDMINDASLLKRVLDGALFGSPVPVILAQNDKPVDLAPKTVLVGWNSKLEAAVALRQAMDMLIQADNVHVAVIDPKAAAYAMGEEPGADVATFLARHGVKTTVDVLASGGREPALVLQQHATDIGAQLVVMGAYSYSRLRERIFGGTTQSMLGNIRTPVLMAR